MIKRNNKKNKGFVILFAVTLSAILLSIALGVMSVALKEVKFGTSAISTNNSFFSADTGVECALLYDKGSTTVFIDPSNPTITCNNRTIATTEVSPSLWSFNISGLNNGGQGCAKVTVDKTVPSVSSVHSKGYNIGGATAGTCLPGTSAVEREIVATYGSTALAVTTPGTIILTADNLYTAYFNGGLIGSGSDWPTAQTYNNLAFQAGKNVLAVQATDLGGGYAGILADIQYGPNHLGTDTTWKFSTTNQDGWQNFGFDDSAWSNVTDYGAYGVAPWNSSVSGMPAPGNTPAHWIWNTPVNPSGNTIYFRGTTVPVSYITVPVNCGTGSKTANQMCQANGYGSATGATGYWHWQCAGPTVNSCTNNSLTCSINPTDCVGAAWGGQTKNGGGSTLYAPTDFGYNCSGWNPGYKVRLSCVP